MNDQEKPAKRGLDGLSDVVRLAAEHLQNSPSRRTQQDMERAAEISSRRHHLIGLRCSGALARQEIALAEFYGRVSRLRMMGSVR